MDKEPETRAVIFDMDGVIVDSERLINTAAMTMFKEKGLDVKPEDFLPFVGAGEERYIGGVAEKYDFPLELSAAKRRTYEIYLDLVPIQLEAFPGAVDFVRRCRDAGLLVAIASSADKIKVQANLNKIRLPVEFWDVVIWGEDVKKKKPAPDIFLVAAKQLKMDPKQCVVVEDAVNGVQAAHAAGMRCVAVATTFPVDKLHEADVVRENIANIKLSDVIR
jgi:HAD superfamily hydrolase (TIGR01509 family)